MSLHTSAMDDIALAEDAALLERCRAGDDSAFADLYTGHRASALRLATILGGSEGADELVAEAISRVFSQLRSGRGPTRDFRSYLHATVRNRYWDLLRHHQHEETASDRPWLLDTAEPGADEHLPELNRNLAVSALATLPGPWQQVLWYLDVEGRKPAEVAELLSISAAAVSSMAYRAREGLKQAYLGQHLIEQYQPLSRDCEWATGKIGSYVRQELGPRATSKLTRHLDSCTQCALALEEAAEVNTRIAGLLPPIVLAGGMAALEIDRLAPVSASAGSGTGGKETKSTSNAASHASNLAPSASGLGRFTRRGSSTTSPATAAGIVAAGPLGLALAVSAGAAAATPVPAVGSMAAFSAGFAGSSSRSLLLGVGAPVGVGLLALAVTVGLMTRDDPLDGGHQALPGSAAAPGVTGPAADGPGPQGADAKTEGSDEVVDAADPGPQESLHPELLGATRPHDVSRPAVPMTPSPGAPRPVIPPATEPVTPPGTEPGSPPESEPETPPVTEVVDVVAVAPTASRVAGCGTFGSVEMPSTIGVDYQLSAGDGRQGAWVVTATSQPGHRLAVGSPSTFDGDLGAHYPCPKLGQVSVTKVGPFTYDITIPVEVADPEHTEVSVRFGTTGDFVLTSYSSDWVCRFDGDGSVIPNATLAAFRGLPGPGLTCSRPQVPGAPLPPLVFHVVSIKDPQGTVSVEVVGAERDVRSF